MSRTVSKYVLNQTLVLSLTPEQRPVALEGNRWVTEPFKGREYVITDSHRDAPVGFQLRVGRTGKSYSVQRKIGGKLVRMHVGPVRDFTTIDKARAAARALLERAQAAGENPHKAAKRATDAADAVTVEGVLRAYREFLTTRQEPARDNTLASFDKQTRRFNLWGWGDRAVASLSATEILDRFDAVAANTRTSAELSFRMLISAVNHAIRREQLNAIAEKRLPLLTGSALDILNLEGRFRSKRAREQDVIAGGCRNPLLGDERRPFLAALWAGRRANPTGTDFLLLSILWGVRTAELACLQWGDTPGVTANDAVVRLDDGLVDIPITITKNKEPHSIPLTSVARTILEHRLTIRADAPQGRRHWVFPAVHPASVSGHYESPRAMMKTVAERAGIDRIAPHDMRRTFATIAESEVQLPRQTVKVMLNHSRITDVTDKYAQMELGILRGHWQRVEDFIMTYCPEIPRSLGVSNARNA